MGFLRLGLVLFGVLTLIYLVMSVVAREKHRSRLKLRWREKGLTGDQRAFIQRGMRRYDHSIRRHMLLLIYVVPLGAIALVIYAVNFM